MSKNRNWCFTLNNYTNEEALLLLQQEKFKYIIFGYEIGENGTKHLQGYFELKNPCGINTLKKINNRMHLEVRKGSQEQAINYCIKDNNIIGYNGEKSNNNGRRKDWQIINDNLKEGKKFNEIIEMGYGSFQHIQHMEKLHKYLVKPRKTKPCVYWICGKSGSGKTKWVFDHYDDIFIKDGTKWWDGYCGQKVVLLDDFRINNIEFDNLLRLLDRYPYKVEIKGGYMEFTSEIIIITTPKEPCESYYGKTNESLDQLYRRIDKIINMDEIIIENNIKNTICSILEQAIIR